MPRLAHGAMVTEKRVERVRRRLAAAAESEPLAFAAVQLTEHQEFDYLFPALQNNPHNLLPDTPQTRDNLVRLGKAMRDTGDDPDANAPISAVWTYFGQFVDHDVTLESVSDRLAKITEPDARPLKRHQIRGKIVNQRTATLDLDSVYGVAVPLDPNNTDKLLLGTVTSLDGISIPELRPEGKDDHNDLPREGRSDDIAHDRAARIGDPRNDENVIIAQLHTAFLRAHNKLVDQGHDFRAAVRALRQHYQWIVIHDYLTSVCDRNIVTDILRYGNQLYHGLQEPFFLPLEYSVAAFRFGHSMVRSRYDFNLNFNNTGPFAGSLELLFTFTALSGQLGFGPDGGTDTLPDNWIIEWERFFDPNNADNRSRAFDTKMVEPLFELRDLEGNVLGQGSPNEAEQLKAMLAVRNLLRGWVLRMPTGQAVAGWLRDNLDRPYGIEVLTPDDVLAAAGDQTQADILEEAGFHERTPLWYYILAESKALANGAHLGPVGSVIVAEVLIGLVRRSSDSILRHKAWKPWLPRADSRTFGLADLLRFAGVMLNPQPLPPVAEPVSDGAVPVS